MPDIVIVSWQEAWEMRQEGFGSKRNYPDDFEVYDQGVSDPVNVTIDFISALNKQESHGYQASSYLKLKKEKYYEQY